MISLLALIFLHAAPRAADLAASGSMLAERAMATAALTGAQLATRQAAKEGKTSSDMVRCTNALDPEVLVPTYRKMFVLTLTPEEIQTVEAFYATDVGTKTLNAGLVQSYRKYGVEPPVPDPVVLESDSVQFSNFVATSAGQKLLRRNVLLDKAPAKLLNDQLQVLFSACVPR